MGKLVTILLIGLLCESIGVVLLSRGLKEIGQLEHPTVSGVVQLVGRGISNPHILWGVFFEALFFITLLMLMSKAEVSFVWPLTSLSFVFATVAAKFFLAEYVSPLRWTGVCFIMLGAALIIWTKEHPHSRSDAPEARLTPTSKPLPPH
jgi:drug/metabolite transporter (DMT)-like permease